MNAAINLEKVRWVWFCKSALKSNRDRRSRVLKQPIQARPINADAKRCIITIQRCRKALGVDKIRPKYYFPLIRGEKQTKWNLLNR